MCGFVVQMGDIPAGDVAKGAKIFKQRCAQCHTTEKVSSLPDIITVWYTTFQQDRYSFTLVALWVQSLSHKTLGGQRAMILSVCWVLIRQPRATQISQQGSVLSSGSVLCNQLSQLQSLNHPPVHTFVLCLLACTDSCYFPGIHSPLYFTYSTRSLLHKPYALSDTESTAVSLVRNYKVSCLKTCSAQTCLSIYIEINHPGISLPPLFELYMNHHVL